MEPRPDNPRPVQSFLQRWAVTALGVMAADFICPGIKILDLTGALIAPLVLGLLNAFLRPLMLLLSLPLLILTLGFFLWVINALLLMLTSSFAGEHFHVDGFWWAMAGAAIISIVSILSNLFLGGGATFTFNKPPRRPKVKDDDDDNGPVIDV
jgi:putative membrane protein